MPCWHAGPTRLSAGVAADPSLEGREGGSTGSRCHAGPSPTLSAFHASSNSSVLVFSLGDSGILHVYAGVLVDFVPDEGRRKQLLTTVAAHFEQEGNVEVAMELERAAGQLEKALDLTNRQLSNALEQMDLRGDSASGVQRDAVDQGASGCAPSTCLDCAARAESLCCGWGVQAMCGSLPASALALRC